jgi:hypothetical protein
MSKSKSKPVAIGKYRYKLSYVLCGIFFILLAFAASTAVTVITHMNLASRNLIYSHGAARIELTGEAHPTKDIFYALREGGYIGGGLHIVPYMQHGGFGSHPVTVIGYDEAHMNLSQAEFTLEMGRMFENPFEVVVARNLIFDDDDPVWGALDVGAQVVIENNDGHNLTLTVVGLLTTYETDGIYASRRIIFTDFDGVMALYTGTDAHRSPLGYDAIAYMYPHTMAAYHRFTQWQSFGNGLYSGYRFRLNMLLPNFDSVMLRLHYTRQVAAGYMILFAILLMCITVFGAMWIKRKKSFFIVLLEDLACMWGIGMVVFIPAQLAALPFVKYAFGQFHGTLHVNIFEEITRWDTALLMQNGLWVLGVAPVIVALAAMVRVMYAKRLSSI